MPLVARASLVLAAPAEQTFDRLADHGAWFEWMPACFCPVGPSQGLLREGLALGVKIAGVPRPISIRVTVVRRPDEIGWVGGLRGVLVGEHRFRFVAGGSQSVEIQSEETWSGLLAWPLWPVIRPKAEQVGRDQLQALAAAVSARR